MLPVKASRAAGVTLDAASSDGVNPLGPLDHSRGSFRNCFLELNHCAEIKLQNNKSLRHIHS